MKKVIEFLQQRIRSYQGHIDLFKSNPNNQAITAKSAEDAKESILELKQATVILENHEQFQGLVGEGSSTRCQAHFKMEKEFTIRGFKYCPYCSVKL